MGPWADADKQVGAEENIPVLDLHADSIAALEKMGKTEGDTLAMAPPPDKNTPAPTTSAEGSGAAVSRFDGTHLGVKGAAVFAHIVESELTTNVPATKDCFTSVAQ